MAKIKKINVSEINGGNNAILPRGTLALYENNNRWALRLHDGSTNGGEPVGDTGDVRFFGGTIVNRNSNESINIAPGGESTSLVYVPGNSQSDNEPLEIANRSETGSVRIGAGGFNWNFVNGGLQLPSGNNANYYIGESMPGLLISSDNNLAIFTNSGDEVHAFMFTDSGSLMFPNGSQQTTAYTGGPNSILDLGIADGTNGQVLTANGDGTFSFTTVDGVSNTLDGLTDVEITSPTTGQVLKFDGVNWVNDTDNAGTAGIDLTDLSVTVAAAGSSNLSYNDSTGVFTFTPPDLSGYLTSYTETDPVFTASAAAGITSTQVTNWDTAYGWGDHTAAGYLIPTINTTSATATSLANNATANLSLTGGRAYVMYKIQTSHAAWVRIYINEAARTADASREQGVDPGITSGVVAEAITAGAETVVFAPAVNGFNDESPATNVMPVAVTNLSGSTNSITVTVTKMTMVA